LASIFNYTNDDVIVENDMNDLDRKAASEKKGQVFEKSIMLGPNKDMQIVTRDFLKKYICYAKSQKSPEITPEVIDFSAKIYSAIRAKTLKYNKDKISMPITVRTLETLIRLATAHAKLRLSKLVEMVDLEVAYGLVEMSIFQDNEQYKDAEEENPEDQEEVYDADRMVDVGDEETEAMKKNQAHSRSQRYQSRHGGVMQQEESPLKSASEKKRTTREPVEPATLSPAKDNGD
jgi:DNA replication licensing factor MCM3